MLLEAATEDAGGGRGADAFLRLICFLPVASPAHDGGFGISDGVLSGVFRVGLSFPSHCPSRETAPLSFGLDRCVSCFFNPSMSGKSFD